MGMGDGVDCVALCIEHDKPYEAIVNTAKNSGCDLVVMASHGCAGSRRFSAAKP